MRALITGARGQVGRALMRSAPQAVQLIALAHGELDVSDAQAIERCVARHRPDVIINAAAYTAVDRAESEPEAARRVNADGPRYLALAARTAGARLLQLSTDYVFDGEASAPYAADATPSPINVYGRTKRSGEVAVLAELPGRALVLRTAWLYGAHGANFLLTMLRLMRERGSVRVVDDQRGTPTSAGSVATALWALAARPEISGLAHWADAGIASWYEFARAIAEDGLAAGLLPAGVTVQPITSAEYPTAARRPRFSALDPGQLPQRLGLERVPWRVRLAAVLGEIRAA